MRSYFILDIRFDASRIGAPYLKHNSGDSSKLSWWLIFTTICYLIKNNFYFRLKNTPPQHYYIQRQNNFVHVYFQISLLGSAKIRVVLLQWLCIAFTGEVESS